MSAPRLLVPAIGAPGETVALPEDEVRHVRSQRLADGAEVVLLDGQGGRALAILSGGRRAARVTALTAEQGEPERRITVILAVAEPARVEWAIEKGTECGAAAFLLAVCERSQSAHARALAARRERLGRIAAEAAKQCDRTRVPEVGAPRPLAELLEEEVRPLMVARPGARRPSGPVPPVLTVAIGPEGGFSPDEETLYDACSATPFGLGGRTLRLETAVVAALSLLVDLP